MSVKPPFRIAARVLTIEQERIRTDSSRWSGSVRLAFDPAKNQKLVSTRQKTRNWSMISADGHTSSTNPVRTTGPTKEEDMNSGGAAAAGAAAAAIAQAVKASGAIVSVKPEAFFSILSRGDKPLVIVSQGGVFKKNYQYLTGYKGFVFHTKSPEPLQFSMHIEKIAAEKIWIPG
jgi:hypothetical protein